MFGKKQETAMIKQESTPDNLLQLAIQKDVDIEKLEKLMALKERWDANQAKKEYYSSLSKFQVECPPILKTKAGYSNRYYYAPLDQIIKVIKGSMYQNELTHRWEQEEKSNQIIITCIITHVSGHSEKTSLGGEADTSGSKNAIQARGSTIQYLRRYTLESVLGIATSSTDTDGHQTDTEIPKKKSSEILIESKNVIDKFENDKELAKKGRSYYQEQVNAGLNKADSKELEGYIKIKYENLQNGNTNI